MKTLLSIIFIFIATVAYSAPFLVCDPQSGVTEYELTGPSWVPTIIPAQPDGSIKMDVANALPGDTNLTFKACGNNPIWGRSCSATVPFTFNRPALPLAPKLPRLAP